MDDVERVHACTPVSPVPSVSAADDRTQADNDSNNAIHSRTLYGTLLVKHNAIYTQRSSGARELFF